MRTEIWSNKEILKFPETVTFILSCKNHDKIRWCTKCGWYEYIGNGAFSNKQGCKNRCGTMHYWLREVGKDEEFLCDQ